MENRTKRILRLETLLRDSGKGESDIKAELAKYKAENRSLKVPSRPLFLLMRQSEYNELLSKSRSRALKARENRDTPSPVRSLLPTTSSASPAQSTSGSSSHDKRWLLRFQELEQRLKAEQEGRALDQKGAKLRLDEVRKENADLRNEIKENKAMSGGGSSSGGAQTSRELKRTGSGQELDSLRTPAV